MPPQSLAVLTESVRICHAPQSLAGPRHWPPGPPGAGWYRVTRAPCTRTLLRAILEEVSHEDNCITHIVSTTYPRYHRSVYPTFCRANRFPCDLIKGSSKGRWGY
eukprot:760765-Hanusia_phi.AAC.1